MTLVFRIELSSALSVKNEITAACNFQLKQGYRLASTFVLGTSLILIFQSSVPKM